MHGKLTGVIVKRISITILLLTCVSIALSVPYGDRPRVITTGSLFSEMTDMVALAKFPDPGFRTVQFSSYDRRSKLPGGPDWFANDDGFGGEPIPGFEKVLKAPDTSGLGEYLIADVQGPGAVVRLWTASISGKVRVYLDDMNVPFYDGEADPFFRHPYDAFPEMKAINGERFRRTVYQRDASYAPIPFARGFRLIWIGKIDEIHFYHVGVRLYTRETNTVTFRPDDIIKYKDIIDRITLVLSDPDSYLTIGSHDRTRIFEASVPLEGKETVLSLKGPGAVAKLSLKLCADDLDKALRQTVLTIVCDEYPRGQVQSPVGDFFGAAPGINPYQSLPFTVTSDSFLTCRFVMPFRDSLRIVLENWGSQSVSVKGEAVQTDFSWDENAMHFYARWRVNHNLIASGSDVQDLPFLLARGKGVYVGTTSYLLNPASVPTSWGNWWGEGDEKVFVDDDTVPSIFGTGSEDYYNYSWSVPDIFFFPYCGQPRNDGPGNRGFVTNFRWHILDAIPFRKTIGFFMELNSHERTPRLSYARIGYHYAWPSTIDDHSAIMPEDLRPLQLPESWQPAARFGARNSVFYAVEEILTDKRNTHLDNGRIWAGGKVLIWTPEKVGDRKTATFLIDSTGMKHIHITAALTPRSGKISVILDDRPLEMETDSTTIDLYAAGRTLLRDFSSKPVELTPGTHRLTLEYRGAGESVSKPEIGLDFIWIQKAGNE